MLVGKIIEWNLAKKNQRQVASLFSLLLTSSKPQSYFHINLEEGGEWVFGSMDLALKSAQIVDLCCKSSGFTDFENTADRGLAVTFEVDSGLCLSYVRTLGPKRNLNRKSFFSLDRYVNEFIQIISFFERTSFYLRCETVTRIILCCCHQTCCLLYYFGKINSGIHMY